MNRSKLFLVIFILCLVSDSIFSQSWQMIGGPTGRTPNDVIITNKGRVLCSNDKGIFISDDLGDSWEISNSSQKFKEIHSLTERLNGEIIAVTWSDGIVKSLNGGESWEKISDMDLNGYDSRIYESPIDSILYVSRDSTVYKSTDGGFNWDQMWQGSNFVDAFTINESGWIYISERYKNILISKDNGNTFLPLNIGVDLSYYLALDFYSDKHGGLYLRLFGVDYIVHFGGNKLTNIQLGWTNIPLGVTDAGDLIYKSGNYIDLFEYSTEQIKTLSCPSFVKDQFAKNIFVSGNTWIANFKYLGLHRSDDAGKTWKSINTGLGFVEGTALEITTNGKIIVSAFSGAFWGNLYSSTSDGVTWDQINPDADPVFYDIDKMADGNLVATGCCGIYTADKDGNNWIERKSNELTSDVLVSKSGVIYTGTRGDGMMISRDNGISWEYVVSLENEYFNAFGESSDGRIFAAVYSNNSGIYFSDDAGQSWSQINPFPYSVVYDFLTKGNTVFAATSGGVYTSDNNGLNWTRTVYKSIKKLGLAPNGDIIGANYQTGMVKSSDNGTNWKIFGEELKDREVRDFCFDEDNRLYALTDSGIFRYGDYIYPFTVSPEYGSVIPFKTVDFKWAIVPSANNYLLELCDDSLFNSNVQRILSGSNFASINSLVPNKTYYWRVTASSTKFNDLYSNTGKFSTTRPFAISQNYPNPFNAGTTIDFYVPYKTRIKLTVYDILGRVVGKLIDKDLFEGDHTYKWNASNLSSGVYLIQLEGDGFLINKKAILIK